MTTTPSVDRLIADLHLLATTGYGCVESLTASITTLDVTTMQRRDVVHLVDEVLASGSPVLVEAALALCTPVAADLAPMKLDVYRCAQPVDARVGALLGALMLAPGETGWDILDLSAFLLRSDDAHHRNTVWSLLAHDALWAFPGNTPIIKAIVVEMFDNVDGGELCTLHQAVLERVLAQPNGLEAIAQAYEERSVCASLMALRLWNASAVIPHLLTAYGALLLDGPLSNHAAVGVMARLPSADALRQVIQIHSWRHAQERVQAAILNRSPYDLPWKDTLPTAHTA